MEENHQGDSARLQGAGPRRQQAEKCQGALEVGKPRAAGRWPDLVAPGWGRGGRGVAVAGRQGRSTTGSGSKQPGREVVVAASSRSRPQEVAVEG